MHSGHEKPRGIRLYNGVPGWESDDRLAGRSADGEPDDLFLETDRRPGRAFAPPCGRCAGARGAPGGIESAAAEVFPRPELSEPVQPGDEHQVLSAGAGLRTIDGPQSPRSGSGQARQRRATGGGLFGSLRRFAPLNRGLFLRGSKRSVRRHQADVVAQVRVRREISQSNYRGENGHEISDTTGSPWNPPVGVRRFGRAAERWRDL